MKKFFVILVSTLFITACYADDDKVIQPNQLPEKAQQILSENFPDDPVVYVTRDSEIFESTTYDVRLRSGAELDFDSGGEWLSIDTAPRVVPDALIPQNILSYVKQNYPDSTIVKIDRDRRDYELELNTDLELVFDLSGKFLRLDY